MGKKHIQIRFKINEVIILGIDSFFIHFFCHTNHMSDLFEKAWEGNFTRNQKKIKIGRKT